MLLLWYAPPFGNGTPAPLYQFATIARPLMVDDDDDAIMLLWWQMMTSPEQE
jgi:hypothetical protein